MLKLKEDTSFIKFLPNISIHTHVFSIILLLKQKLGIKECKCGYLGILLATNVASEEIILETAGLGSSQYLEMTQLVQKHVVLRKGCQK